MSKEPWEARSLPEILEFALAKAKQAPLKEAMSLEALLQSLRIHLMEQWFSAQDSSLLGERKRPYSLMHRGGQTPYSLQIEELLNIDRMTSGLSPLLFNGRPLPMLSSMTKEDR